MRKKVLVGALILIIFCISLVSAEDAVATKGYECLEDKVSGECSSLSTEEKAFSLLTIDRCRSELVDEGLNNECWPDSGCKIKTTAQAILALNSVGSSTVEAENWLLEQQISPANLDWLLQIDLTSEGSCTISYQGNSYSVSIEEDKTVDSHAGACLRVYDDYWLRVSPSCLEEEFSISCDQTFSTSLLYQKEDSGVIYVSKNLNSASAEGTTTEKVNSYCFKQGAACNYEGTLWAALVLKTRGYDVSSYLPYLVTLKDEYIEFVPESFLYVMTNKFSDELLLMQKEGKWWSESGDKFYDSAVALYSLQNEEPQEKIDAKAWLEEVQGSDGCWQGNIRNTAFILFSAWPRKTLFVNDTDLDCEDEGYSCMSSAACTESSGDVLVDYSGCFGSSVCCSVGRVLESCEDQGGETCRSGESCLGGRMRDASDTTRCCVGGECGEAEEPEEETECEQRGGTCRVSCERGEESTADDCEGYELCCMGERSSEGRIWIWILIILIVLVIIGIIFKDKLRQFYFKFKSKLKRGKSKGGPGRPGRPGRPRGPPPGASSRVMRRPVQRRILTPGNAPAKRPMPGRKRTGELDEVLKKLKEMGK